MLCLAREPCHLHYLLLAHCEHLLLQRGLLGHGARLGAEVHLPLHLHRLLLQPRLVGDGARREERV